MLTPAVGQVFTHDISWDPETFIFAAVLVASTGFTYVLAARRLPTLRLRVLAGSGLEAMLLAVWAELAIGIFS